MCILLDDFMEMFTEAELQNISLYDVSSNETVFEGEYRDCPSKYDNCEICSIETLFDKTTTLVINIDLEI